MLYRGQFRDINDVMVTVYIQTKRSSTEVVEIGDDSGDIYFSKDPITIEQDIDNTFDILFTKSCEIELIAKKYLGDNLFTGDSREVIVNIWKGTKCIFAGFLEPNIYSQPFDHYYNSIKITATDALGTLQYFNYANITDTDTYDARKEKYGEVTFTQIIKETLRDIPTMNLQDGRINKIYYDGSVRTYNNSTVGNEDVFSEIKVSEYIWLGEEFDDIVTEDEMLEDVLKFLDLKVRQDGCDFYIYSLQSIFALKPIKWVEVCQPDVYIREENKYYAPQRTSTSRAVGWTAPREILTNTLTGEEILGNPLQEVLSDNVEIINDNGKTKFVNYYYVVLPSGNKVKSNHWELASTKDDVLKIGNTYKILNIGCLGDYDWDNLKEIDEEFVNGYYTLDGVIDNKDVTINGTDSIGGSEEPLENDGGNDFD